MPRMAWIAGAAAIAVAAGVAAWLLLAGDEGPRVASAETIAEGERLYQANCASCHGADGAGQANWRERGPDGKLPAPPLNGSGHTWHHPDSQLTAIITQGVEAMAPAGYKSDMRGFGERLSDAEIQAILAYVKSTWPNDKLARQQEVSAKSGG